LNNDIDCFSPLQAGELIKAGIKALSELAIAYAWLEDCRSRASPLANFSPLRKSFELWRAFIIRNCEEMSYPRRWAASTGWPGPPLSRPRLRLQTPQRGGCEMAQTPTPDADQQAIALIQISGILNPNMTLDKIMELTGQISRLQDDAPKTRFQQTFIGSFFAFKHVI
jgi:hypothetical protein